MPRTIKTAPIGQIMTRVASVGVKSSHAERPIGSKMPSIKTPTARPTMADGAMPLRDFLNLSNIAFLIQKRT